MSVDDQVWRAVLHSFLRDHLAAAGPADELDPCGVGLGPSCRQEPDDPGAELEAREWDVCALAGEALAAARRRAEGDRAAAARDLEELLPLGPDARQKRVAETPGRFRSPALAEQLLSLSGERAATDPREALELAGLAATVALRVDPVEDEGCRGLELLARASALKGNALRVAGELALADESLAVALAFFHRADTGDPLVEAELLSLCSSLRRDQHRLEDALALLDRVAELYAEVNDRQRQAHTWIKRSCVLRHLDPQLALEAVQTGLDLLGPDGSPELILCGRYNQVLYLADAGRYGEARRRLAAHRDEIQRQAGRGVRPRLYWLDGRIAHGLGETAAAEVAYGRARDGFFAAGRSLDGALVCLDLALLYLEQGRSARVRQLAEALIPLFHLRELPREAMAALLMFQDAAEREAVTTDLVQRLVLLLGNELRLPVHRLES